MIEKVSGPHPNAVPVGIEGKEKIRMVPFIIGGKEYVLDRKIVMKQLGVADIVRVQKDDFPNLPEPGGDFAHFNDEVSVNKSGEKYLFTEIKESRQPEPCLILDGARMGGCIEAVSGISYDEAEARGYLAKSLPGLRTTPDLQAGMFGRYGTSRKCTFEEMGKRKLGVTVFELEGLAPQEKIRALVTPPGDQVKVDDEEKS